MKKFYIVLPFWVISFFVCLSSIQGQTLHPDFQDGEIYFKFRDHITPASDPATGNLDTEKHPLLHVLMQKYQISSCKSPFIHTRDVILQKTFLIEFSALTEIDDFVSDLNTIAEVEYAEKVPVFHLFLTPNDTYYGNVSGILGSVNAKWHLDRIKADSAWDISTGSAGIKVAVLDNAIWTAHPDLSNKIVTGIDLADNDNDPNPPTADLTWSHGTHTSGLVGAQSNNGIGVASIGYNVSLMAVKVARNSDGALTAGYEGILWAADNGADVISMSWGTTQYFQTMQHIANYAYNKGSVLVAAAGNDGNDTIQYPAGLHHVISVGSTDGSDALSNFSCYGPWVDVCAPGGFPSGGLFSVLSTTYSDASFIGAALYGVSGKYDVMQGTSMSCPIAAGLCGLILSVDSTLTPEKLENILKMGCDNIDAQNPGFIGMMGAGRINAFKALKIAQDSVKTLIADFYADETTVLAGSIISFTDQSTGSPTSWNWSFPGGNPSASNVQSPSGILYENPGIYPVTLTIGDGSSSNTEVKTNFIIVKQLPSSVWIPQSTGFTTQYRGIRNISIVDPQIVWASAYDGSGAGATVLEFTRTSDGGNTWTPGIISGLPSGLDMSELFAINKDTAWAAMWGNTSGGNGIFRTNDGGASWIAQTTAQFSGTAAFPNTVYFWDENNGVCLGDPNGGYFEIYTTADGGNNWVRVPQADIPAPIAGEYGYNGGKDYCVVGNTIWYGTNNGNVFRSTDRGLHWTKYPTGCYEVNNITFSDELNGIIEYKAYNQSTGQLTHFEMKYSDDGGETWLPLNPAGDYFHSDIEAVPGKPGMYITTGTSQNLPECGSAYSLDYGRNWTMIDDSVQYTCVKFFDVNSGWAGGFNQSATSEGIWKWMGLIQDSVNIIPEFMADRTQINIGDTVNFTDLSLGNIVSWTWDFQGGNPTLSNDQHPAQIVYNTAGNYTVTMTCNNADTSVIKTKTAYIHVSSGGNISESGAANLVKIFPNPVSGNLYIESCIDGGSYFIRDVSGRVIFNGQISRQHTAVDVSILKSGLYFIEIIQSHGAQMMKFIKN